MSTPNDYNRFANSLVGSVSCIPDLGNIYWCHVSNKSICGFYDASAFRPCITILRQKDDTCLVRSHGSNPREKKVSSVFSEITREALTAIATDLLSPAQK